MVSFFIWHSITRSISRLHFEKASTIWVMRGLWCALEFVTSWRFLTTAVSSWKLYVPTGKLNSECLKQFEQIRVFVFKCPKSICEWDVGYSWKTRVPWIWMSVAFIDLHWTTINWHLFLFSALHLLKFTQLTPFHPWFLA